MINKSTRLVWKISSKRYGISGLTTLTQKSSTSAYKESRLQNLKKLKNTANNANIPFPIDFDASVSVPQIIHSANGMKISQKQNSEISTCGRVISVRKSSNKLFFYDIQSDGAQIQIISNLSNSENEQNFAETTANIRRGDIIGITGNVGRSIAGVLSIFSTRLDILSRCLHVLPTQYYGFKDREQRYRQRYIDLMLNDNTRMTFHTRARVINILRRFLDSHGFLEVETPMMSQIPGGAAAKPFKTFHCELDVELFMRVAPELYLKMCVIGGLERVYEIGKNFRNEGVDTTHNPEFTSCEFYWAYKDYYFLMDKTEELLRLICNEFFPENDCKIEYDGKILDFKDFKRIQVVPALESVFGEEIPRPFDSAGCFEFLLAKCEEHKLSVAAPVTIVRVFDRLISHFIEQSIIQPTFVMNHPLLMCPLARQHRDDSQLSERFELFISGKEVCNSYSELNDPIEQRERFEAQKRDCENDEEAHKMNEDYCRALEYGLPPTAGWGVGIDRLVMFFTGATSIRDVILFPALRAQ